MGVVSVAMADAAPAADVALRSPFPWFGGKRRVAPLVWSRFGPVDTFNEAFAGSLAVLLGRPSAPRVETVNDVDCMLVNFWRAVQHDPEAVAYYADGPVNEADLHARHRWLVERGFRRVLRCKRDPYYFNAKIAGWWVWGQCLWIGSGWCQRPDWSGRVNVGRSSRGVHAARSFDGAVEWNQRPDLSHVDRRGALGAGERPWLQSKKPAASRTGTSVGVHRQEFQFDRNGNGTAHQKRRPHLSSDQGATAARRWQGGGQGGGSGVHAPTLAQQKPDLSGDGSAGRGVHAPSLLSSGLYDYMQQLASRLRRVRVCCGDWSRVLTPSVTTYIGVTGVFLDPPYSHELRERCYAEDHDISADVRAWAIAHGDDPKMRIALCGYIDEHGDHMPSTWECVPWKAHGGYSRSERGVANRSKERIWFSPHCLKPDLLSGIEAPA